MISGASEQELELAKVVSGSWCISKEQLDYFVSLEKENKRLKNNWNELKGDVQAKITIIEKVLQQAVELKQIKAIGDFNLRLSSYKDMKGQMQELEEKRWNK